MCGRTACTLDPHLLPKACQYTDSSGNKRQPKWKNNDCSKYYPSYNMSPYSFTPVLVSCKPGSHNTKEDDEQELQVMRWGLVPSWYRGDVASFGYKMNNARIESITEKQTFKGPLEKGRRCVVLADGFYEWQEAKGGGQKQPYFIYFKEKVKDEGNNEMNDSGVKPATPLLTMAGIYDVWPSPSEEPLYSYSVITLEARAPFRSIHHRVPAILKDEEEVKKWLDCEISFEEALKLLTPDDCLDWHPVSRAVNNSSYKEPDCIKEIDLFLAEKKAERSKITNWFKRSTKKREASSSASDHEPGVKKEKLDKQ